MNYLFKFFELYSHPAIILWRAIETKHLSQVLNQINFVEPILDLGCGEGKVSSVIFDHINVGLDTEVGEIKKAKLTGTYSSLIVGDGCNLPFVDEIFGLIFSNCVIEHIPNIDNVLREISRVLKKYGYFIFTVPSENFGKYLFFYVLFSKLRLKTLAQWYSSKRNEYLQHYNIFSNDVWMKKLNDVNLRIIVMQQYLSKSALEVWDLLAFLGFFWRKLCLNKLQILIKRAPKFDKMKTRIYTSMLEKYYYEHQNTKGGGLLIVAQKRDKNE